MASIKYVIGVHQEGKGYTGLQNKATSIEDAEQVAKQSIKYAAQYYGLPVSDFYAEIRTDKGLFQKRIG